MSKQGHVCHHLGYLIGVDMSLLEILTSILIKILHKLVYWKVFGMGIWYSTQSATSNNGSHGSLFFGIAIMDKEITLIDWFLH